MQPDIEWQGIHDRCHLTYNENMFETRRMRIQTVIELWQLNQSTESKYQENISNKIKKAKCYNRFYGASQQLKKCAPAMFENEINSRTYTYTFVSCTHIHSLECISRKIEVKCHKLLCKNNVLETYFKGNYSNSTLSKYFYTHGKAGHHPHRNEKALNVHCWFPFTNSLLKHELL